MQSEKGLGGTFTVELGLADYHSDAELGQRGGSCRGWLSEKDG